MGGGKSTETIKATRNAQEGGSGKEHEALKAIPSARGGGGAKRPLRSRQTPTPKGGLRRPRATRPPPTPRGGGVKTPRVLTIPLLGPARTSGTRVGGGLRHRCPPSHECCHWGAATERQHALRSGAKPPLGFRQESQRTPFRGTQEVPQSPSQRTPRQPQTRSYPSN